MRNAIIGLAVVMTGAVATSAFAGATYELTPRVNGANSVVLNWGESFSIDIGVSITEDTLPGFNSAVFQMRFTDPGLVLNSYAWDAPFGTGDIFDDSTPGTANLPAVIGPTTFFDPSLPTATDLEFSNVSISDDYGTGDIVSLGLSVPNNFGFTGTIFVSIAADTLANGFSELPARGGQVLQITIVPSPATAMLALCGTCVLTRRRRS